MDQGNGRRPNETPNRQIGSNPQILWATPAKKEIVAFTPCPTAAANVGGLPTLSPMTQKRKRKTKIEPRLFTALFIELARLSRSFPGLVAVPPVHG